MRQITIAFACFLGFATAVFSQTPTLFWAGKIGGASQDQGQSIATDAQGNVVAVGKFRNAADLDLGPGFFNQTSAGQEDVFITKSTPNGGLLWAKRIGGTGVDQAIGVATDTNGEVYVTGTFQSTVDFDPGADSYNMTTFGSNDIFVVHLDANGDFVAAQQIGGPGNDNSTSIHVTSIGEVYVTGYFTGTADFDPDAGTQTRSAGTVGFDGFVLKLTNLGAFDWVVPVGSPGVSDFVQDVTTDGSGNVVAVGAFQSTADFDPGVGTFNLTSAGEDDAFSLKMTSTGGFVWAKRIGGLYADALLQVETDGANNIYTGGYFSDTVDFDPGAGTTTAIAIGASDAFVEKLNSSGAFTWAKRVGAPAGDASVGALDVASNGTVYAGGNFLGTADFDPGTGTTSHTSQSYDGFFWKLDANGQYLFSSTISSAGFDAIYAIQYGPLNAVHAIGYFGGTADFDPGSGTTSLTPTAGSDAFVFKLRQCSPSSGSFSATACSNYLSPSGHQVWTTSGVYHDTITNTTGCDSFITATMTFNPPPTQPGTITGNTSVCVGASQTFSIAPVSGATGYTWTLPMGWTGSSSSTSITATATPSAVSGFLSVVTNVNTCSSAPQTIYVTINGAPSQPEGIGGNTTVCAGTSQTYTTVAIPNTTGYTWTLPSGWSGTSTSTSITATVGTSGGTITLTADNACGSSAPVTTSITVNNVPAQPTAISGTATLCVGASQVYSIPAVSGATSYTWTLPSGWSGTSTTTSITATAGTSGGTISVVANNGCGGSTPRTLTATVISAPSTPGAISGVSTVCTGTSQVFSIGAVSGATSYIWTLPSGWSGTSTSTSITATAGAAGGTISVAALNSCDTSSVQTLSVAVTTAVPAQPGTITGSVAVCAGTGGTYSISSVSGATGYTWTLPSGWTGSSTTNSITVTTSGTSGTISVTANNGCGSSTAATLAVTSNTTPAQPGTISGSATVCAGTSQTYTIAAVPGATGYIWTLPSGWTGSSTSTSITATAGTSGTISVVANAGICNSTAQTLAVTVNSAPSAPTAITGNNTVCAGTSQLYTATAVSGATSYTWTLPSGWSGTSTSSTITATPGTTGGSVQAVANNACGSSSATVMTVTVNNIPAQPTAINGNTTLCAGSSQVYTITSVSGATGYTWTLPSGWSGSSTTTSIAATAGTSGGTISVVANNGCGTSTASTLPVTVPGPLTQPGTISGSSPMCTGTSQSFSINPVPGATSYIWTLPSGWSGSSTSTSITATAGASGGTISVVAINACDTSSLQSMNVAVTTAVPAQPAAITGNATICVGANEIYAVTADPGATGYTWTLPSGWSGSSTSNTITATAGASGGTISVTAENGCGSSTAQTVSVTVNDVPAQPSAISGNATGCEGDALAFSVTADPNATSYLWTLPSGWSGSSTSNVLNAQAGTGAGTITVVAENNCGSSAPQTISVSASPAIVASFSSTTNMGTVDFTDLSSNATGWAWDFGDGSTSSLQNPTHTYAATGTYQVCLTATNADCMDTTCITVVVTTVGSLEVIPVEVNVFPNPSKGQFVVEVMEPVQAEVYSIHGQKLVSQQLEAGRNAIDLTAFASGVYTLQVTGVNGKATVKLVKTN